MLAGTGTWPMQSPAVVIQRWYRQRRDIRRNWNFRRNHSTGGAWYQIELIAALVNKLAIAPVVSIIMPFVAKNRKRRNNRRLEYLDERDDDFDPNDDDYYTWAEDGWMGTRRMIQRNSILWRMGYQPSRFPILSTRQWTKRQLARGMVLQSQRFDRSAQIPAIVGKYGYATEGRQHASDGNRAQWLNRFWGLWDSPRSS
jgi:hypothetical protein